MAAARGDVDASMSQFDAWQLSSPAVAVVVACASSVPVALSKV